MTVITAWRQELTENENRHRMGIMENEFRKLGLKTENTSVSWNGMDEPAFKVWCLKKQHAIALAHSFNQDAIVFEGEYINFPNEGIE